MTREPAFPPNQDHIRATPQSGGAATAEDLPRGVEKRAAFPWELSRARLKRFPVLLESDEDGQFAGVTIFKTTREKAGR